MNLKLRDLETLTQASRPVEDSDGFEIGHLLLESVHFEDGFWRVSPYEFLPVRQPKIF